MYPNLYYFFKDVFGVEWTFLKMVQSFGFFVAIAFVTAAYFFAKELKRKEQQGLLSSWKEKVKKGEKLTAADYILPAVIGFVLGYKLLYIILNGSAFVEDTQGFLLSSSGNILGGVIGAALGVWSKISEKKKELKEYPQPKTIDETVHPYQMVGTMTLIAAVAGLLGAKIFHNLENPSEFAADPIGALLSFSGLTMYGGLICGGAAVIWYARKKGISIPHLIDSCAPALMLAYGIGRIGCQVAGDGDWGIPNSAYITDIYGNVQAATMEQFNQRLQEASQYYTAEFGSVANVPHAYVPAPSWLPDWMFAYSYPNNVNNAGSLLIEGCEGNYCDALPTGVFPTPLYEAAICIMLFFVLWGLRKRIVVPGVLFSVYLIFNGIERFFVEQIRVNTTLFNIGSYEVTQAMFIAIILILLGITGVIYFRRRAKQNVSLS
jgi:phosphatidylglycerol---prolipoprotein diacylglyceryl transferase